MPGQLLNDFQYRRLRGFRKRLRLVKDFFSRAHSGNLNQSHPVGKSRLCLGKTFGCLSSPRFLRNAPPAFIITPPPSSTRTVRCWARYRKMHIPDDPLYYEKFYFTPGDLGFKAWQTRYGKIGVLICWDQWYPEAARLTALQGAQILFYPTAIGWHPGEKKKYGECQHNSWETIQRSHAIANGCYVAVANRIGHEKLAGQGIEFWGQSFVAGTSGEILAKAGAAREEILIVPVDLAAVDDTRTHWPFLRDRRIDAYGGLTKRLID